MRPYYPFQKSQYYTSTHHKFTILLSKENQIYAYPPIMNQGELFLQSFDPGGSLAGA